MIRRYALRDDQWDAIKDLLPGRVESVGATARDNRLFGEVTLQSTQVKPFQQFF